MPLIACCLWACAAAAVGAAHFAAGAAIAAAGCLVSAGAASAAQRAGRVALPAFLAAAAATPTVPPPAPLPGPVRIAGPIVRIVRTPSLGGAFVHVGAARVALDGEIEALPGDHVELLGHATAPLAPGMPTTLRGVAATARVRPGAPSLPRAAAAARRALEQQLLARLPGEAGPLVAGLVLGRDTRPSAATQAAHRGTGLSHLLAVSGAHAAMLALLVGLGGARGRRRILADGRRTVALLALLFAYAFVTGGEPPVLRAVMGYALAAAAVHLGRPCGAGAILLAPALGTALAAPHALLGASFLLSYAAVAGLLLAGPPPAAPWWRRWLVAPLQASAWATLLTAPLTLWFFGQVAPWTVVLTPLLAPLVAALLLGGLALALLGLVAPTLAGLVAPAVAGLADVYLAAVHAADGLPWTPVPAACAPTTWALLVALAAACWCVHRSRSRRSVAVAAALLALPHFLPRPHDRAPFLLLAAVGHGQACLVGDAAGRRVAIDCGSVQAPGRAAEQLVAALARRRLDLLVVTHADADHHNAVSMLLERVTVAQAVLPARLADGALAAQLAAHGADVTIVPPGARCRPWPGLAIAAPQLPADAPDNDQSLWVCADVGATRALLTGDAQELGVAAALAQGLAPPCDLLVLPHHGRANANAARLLQACRPTACFASAAAADGPTRLGGLVHARGAALWSTGLHGPLRLCGVTGAVGAAPLPSR